MDVLTVFANSIAGASKEIEGYFRGENWKNYTTKVHALKSTAKIIGAVELSERARRLEDAGNAGYVDEIRQDHRPLMELYLSYGEKLRPFIVKEEEEAGKPLIREAELAEAFEAMEEIASAFDYDSLVFLFEALDDYHLPEKEAKIYREIKEAAATPDWERIRELLGMRRQGR